MEDVHSFDKEEQQRIAVSVNEVVNRELKSYKEKHNTEITYHILVDNVRSVGVQGDERTYKRCMELKLKFPNNLVDYDLVARLSTSITNEVSEINRVLCDYFS